MKCTVTAFGVLITGPYLQQGRMNITGGNARICQEMKQAIHS